MIKKKGPKKVIIITLSVVLLALAVLFAVMYYNYTKEICVIVPLEHMLLEEGVSKDNILVEMGYSIIINGEDVENYLFIFKNGDIYSGYFIDPDYANDYSGWEKFSYFYNMDDRDWDYLYEQCYWGRLSSRDLDGVINELAQIDFVFIDEMPEPQMETRESMRTGMQIGIRTPVSMKTQIVRTNDQENNDIYVGHGYKGRMESDGFKSLEWISRGSSENMIMYYNDVHAHNAIDIIKSTWAYEQWTNQIFGEGWEERIDLKDELEEDRL